MTRKNKSVFLCIVCNQNECIDKVICISCEYNEMEHQKNLSGSITEAQIYFMHKISNEITIQETIQKMYPDYVWELSLLSCIQAKKVIAELQNMSPEDAKNE